MNISMIGLDTAKSVFQVHAVDPSGKVAMKRKLQRGELIPFFEKHDLIEFTLLKAYLEADRQEEARHLLSARRPGASGVPVAGVPVMH